MFPNWTKEGARTLIFGHSDYTTNILKSLPLFISGGSKLWGTNTKPYGVHLHSLPLGLTNMSNESGLHKIYGNQTHFLHAGNNSEFAEEFKNSIYANFSVQTMPSVRLKLANLLNSAGVKLDEIDNSDSGRIKYLMALRSNNFTICPVGNGPDTHRLWETLYMGGTPVVLSSPYTNDLLADLPVVILESWNQLLDSKKMERRWLENSVKSFNFEKLYAGYWITKFCSRTLSDN